MSIKKFSMLLLSAMSLAALLNGCGSSGKEGTADLGSVAKSDESGCRVCHSTTLDPAISSPIVQDYLASPHNLVPNAKSHYPDGIGCQGCHGGGAQHNGVGPIPYPNPDAAGKCFECHQNYLPAAHYTSTGTSAMYIGVDKSCKPCHAPHKNNKTVRHTEWAESGHGKVTGEAWSHYDFTIRDTCNSCHTAAGFAKVVNNNFTDKKALSTTTLGKQPLRCDGCHSSNDYKNSIRQLSTAYAAPYTPSLGASKAFPGGDVIGNSQLCIPCHAGLDSGASVEALDETKMNNTSFKNSHYMAAAGLMYVKNGFTGFIDPATVIGTSTYGASLKATDDGGAVGSTHRKLGTAAMATDSHPGGQVMLTGGPCVTCHMPKAGHTWEINASAFNAVCVNCHSKEGTTTLTADNFETVFIEEQSAVFQDALALAKAILGAAPYNIEYDAANYPYFFKVGTAHTRDNGITDWTRGGALTNSDAKKLMGACFNINLLSREPAAYAHARTYARRLIYDSIDFLDDKTINMSVGATALATMPAVYTKGPVAYDGAAPYAGGTLNPGTSPAMAYLLGWGYSGAWNPIERP